MSGTSTTRRTTTTTTHLPRHPRMPAAAWLHLHSYLLFLLSSVMTAAVAGGPSGGGCGSDTSSSRRLLSASPCSSPAYSQCQTNIAPPSIAISPCTPMQCARRACFSALTTALPTHEHLSMVHTTGACFILQAQQEHCICDGQQAGRLKARVVS